MKEQHNVRLPIEILAVIISHISDPGTLYSLLTVSSPIFDLAVRQLYYNPFQLIMMKGLHTDDFRRNLDVQLASLRTLLLLLSPYEDELTRIALEIGGVIRHGTPDISGNSTVMPSISTVPTDRNDTAMVSQPRTNYLRYIRSFEYSIPDHIRREWYFPVSLLTFDSRSTFLEMLNRPWGYNGFEAMAHTSITWACVGHQLSQLRALQIPVHDIERYILHVKQLSRLEHIVFDLDAVDIYDESLSSELFEFRIRPHVDRCLELVRLLAQQIQVDSNRRCNPGEDVHNDWPGLLRHRRRPMSATFYAVANEYELRDLLEEYESRLYEVLPPLEQPTSLTPANWERFLCKANEVDLTHVEHVWVGVKDRSELGPDGLVVPSWNDVDDKWGSVFAPRAAPRILQSCRSLRKLEGEIDVDNLFGWAVDEKKQANTTSALDKSTPATSRLVRLRNVSLLCTSDVSLNIVNDTMAAFASTIETVDLKWMPANPEALERCSIVLGGVTLAPWLLPQLRKLHLEYSADIYVHPTTFENCPQLEYLHLLGFHPEATLPPHKDKKGHRSGGEEPSKQQPSDVISQVPAWTNLPKLHELVLTGTIALAFHPETLHSTPLLTKLVLRDSGGYRRGMSSNSVSSLLDHWTWDWDLPWLEHLELEGPMVSKLDFLMTLQHMPRLQIVRLMNQGRRQRLLPAWTPSTDSEKSVHHHHRQLRSLTLSGAWMVNDHDIEQLVNCMAPRLAHLAFHRGCKGFTIQGFVHHTAKRESTTFKLGECHSHVLHRVAERELGLERRPPSGPGIYKTIWGRIPELPSEVVLWDDADDNDDDDDNRHQGHDKFINNLSRGPTSELLNFCVYIFGGTQFRIK